MKSWKKVLFTVVGLGMILAACNNFTNQAVKPEQITMKVVNMEENADAEYTTVWLTPSARIYKLAKNIPEYQRYIDLMEKSKKDGSLLTFTLATDDSSLITRVQVVK
jgi:hypothetical protein